jgi:hypothetical protein
VPASVLSAHNILIAAIFTTYMGGMAGLLGYVCWTGRERRIRDPERSEDDAGPGVLLAATMAA